MAHVLITFAFPMQVLAMSNIKINHNLHNNNMYMYQIEYALTNNMT